MENGKLPKVSKSHVQVARFSGRFDGTPQASGSLSQFTSCVASNGPSTCIGQRVNLLDGLLSLMLKISNSVLPRQLMVIIKRSFTENPQVTKLLMVLIYSWLVE